MISKKNWMRWEEADGCWLLAVGFLLVKQHYNGIHLYFAISASGRASLAWVPGECPGRQIDAQHILAQANAAR